MFKLIRSLAGLVIIFGIGYLFGIKGVKFYQVSSDSMIPTLEPGDRLIGVKPDVLTRGDIVILADPDERGGTIVKRLIAIGDATVRIADGTVRVDGERLDEPYLKEKPDYQRTEEVPPGKMYVLGDNRNNSADSHVWGPLPVSSVKSRIVFRYWPRSRVSFVGRRVRF
jgi:signal peptidase I